MLRMSIAGVSGFILVFVESYIVMLINEYHTIEYDGIVPFIRIWAMNFFLVFAILTHIKFWYTNKLDDAAEKK